MKSLCISYDVEDYYMASCYDSQFPRSKWNTFESKLKNGYYRGLEILQKKGIKGTFFFLGVVAEKYPEILKEAFNQGHEIASHGYDHRLVSSLSLKEFEEDIKKSTDVIESIIGDKIFGYRAPTFSLDITSKDHIGVLKKYGYKYDSSYFPLSWKSNTKDNLSKDPFKIDNDFWEIPLSTSKFLSFAMPIGGGYFRLYLKSLNNHLIKKSLKERDTIIYLHPWEFLNNHPFYPKKRFTRFRHTFNIGDNTISKLESILSKGYQSKKIIELINEK